MRRSIFFFQLVVLPALLWAQRTAETMFTSNVSQSTLQTTVRDLVKFAPRMGGTQRGDLSTEYILTAFRTAGLQAEIIEDPERLAFTNERWSLNVEQPESLRGLIKNEWLAGYSPSVKQQTARLVYAKPGDTTEGKKFDGAVVLTERAVHTQLYSAFEKAGTVCILTFSPATKGKYDDWALVTSLKASGENPIPMFNISYNNGVRLKSELERGAEVVISFMTETTIAPGKPKTVIATINGESDEYFIVCAHGDSDSGGPGADDNASGEAGVLEVARVLQNLINAKTIPAPKKSIKFVVWGSEYYSTSHYVKRNSDALTKILGVMNYDEIGAGATRNCLYFESNDVQHNEPLLRMLNAVGEEYVGKPGFWDEATTNPSQGGTDSYVFLPEYLKRLGVPNVAIPSVSIFTAAWDEPALLKQTPGWASKAWKGHPDTVVVDYSAYYHASLDIPSLTTDVEPFNMVWAVKAVGIALLRLAW
ncbi:MAG TPA: M28 family peptidase [Bacteroidota bacterium]